jgi:hypothetical protein
MQRVADLSDTELLLRTPRVVRSERGATVEVIEHLAEIGRRKLFLGEACSSLYRYCRDRLGYSEDEAHKRAQVAKTANEIPGVLNELREGSIHLTGLFLLSRRLTAENAEVLFEEARGKSRRAIERMLASRFPSAEVDCAGRIVPLSATRARVEFTASTSFCEKLTRAQDLCSHSVPSGAFGPLLERALDVLIAQELKRRDGASRSTAARDSEVARGERTLTEGSRHIPVAVARAVRARDGERCTYEDALGRRCEERRFLTLEHRHPYALGGEPSVENLCVLCQAHNSYAAVNVFGEGYIAARRAAAKGRARSEIRRSREENAQQGREKLGSGDRLEEHESLQDLEDSARAERLGDEQAPPEKSERECERTCEAEPNAAESVALRIERRRSPRLEKTGSGEGESREMAVEPLEMTNDALVVAACGESEGSVEALRGRVLAGLCWLGFRREEAKRALAQISGADGVEQMMRSALMSLTSRGVAAA